MDKDDAKQISSDDEDIDDSPFECVCHYESNKKHQIIRPVTQISWGNITEVSAVWKSLSPGNEPEQAMAYTIPNLPTLTTGYHPTCYKKYTERRLFKPARRKREMQKLSSPPAPPKKKVLKMAEKTKPAQKTEFSREQIKTTPIHPSFCIICKSRSKHIKNKFGMRTSEQLTQCKSAGRLRETAEKFEDGDILNYVPVDDKDLKEICVKYHASCLKQYSRFTYTRERRNRRKGRKRNQIPLTKSFEHLCNTIIEEQILKNSEVIRINALRDAFVKIAMEQENIDIRGIYYSSCLKKRLVTRYGDKLKFYQTHRSLCEVVQVADATDDKEANLGIHNESQTDMEKENLAHVEERIISGDEEDCSESYNLHSSFNEFQETALQAPEITKREDDNVAKTSSMELEDANDSHVESNLHELFNSAKIIRELLQSMKLSDNVEDGSMKSIETNIPNIKLLIKLLMWCTGHSDDINMNNDDIPVDLQQKILFISNHLILATKK